MAVILFRAWVPRGGLMEALATPGGGRAGGSGGSEIFFFFSYKGHREPEFCLSFGKTSCCFFPLLPEATEDLAEVPQAAAPNNSRKACDVHNHTVLRATQN